MGYVCSNIGYGVLHVNWPFYINYPKGARFISPVNQEYTTCIFRYKGHSGSLVFSQRGPRQYEVLPQKSTLTLKRFFSNGTLKKEDKIPIVISDRDQVWVDLIRGTAIFVQAGDINAFNERYGADYPEWKPKVRDPF